MSENNRKYPRVFLTKGVQQFDKIIGIEVKLPDESNAGILDISYAGAAVLKSTANKTTHNKGDKISLSFIFADQPDSHPLSVEVIREDQKMMAVRFLELPLNTRLALQKFLKEKLIGLNVHLVAPEFYIKEQGFDFWFHGPNETNIFIWGSRGGIQKATIEIDRQVLTVENKQLYVSRTKDHLNAPTEDYAYQVNHPQAKEIIDNRAPIVTSALSLLSQIKDDTGIIEHLSQDILSAKY